MAHYALAHIDLTENRSELHDLLHLTGAEVSYNVLPAGAGVPFVHRHTQNEEIYFILEGQGTLYIDGEELPPQGRRRFPHRSAGRTLPARRGRRRHALHLHSGQGGQP
ncbi:MAG: cupin domain-containing protein [Bilophila sp.]